MHWSEVLPFLFSHILLFSTLAAFSAYWALALYLSWNQVYLVTVRHLKLSDPLYLVGITLPYVVGGIALLGFSALADSTFRRTGSHRRSYVYPGSALLMVSALCLFLAVNIPSSLRSRHLVHPRTHRGRHTNFIDHHHGGSTGSTPWGCPGYCCGGQRHCQVL